MDSCVIPLELFMLIVDDDWRIWSGLVGACKALNRLLRCQQTVMFKRALHFSLVPKSTTYRNNYYVRWYAPNMRLYKEIEIYKHEDRTNILLIRRWYNTNNIIDKETSYIIKDAIWFVEYRRDDALIYRWSRVLDNYRLTTLDGVEFVDARKDVALKVLDAHNARSFMIDYLPNL
ncbi:hypothetical protein D5b_00014 [Faustovirus]|nr:hypothetical protein D5b_00014 [Faustovirus]AMN84895.1 hypothetical protein D6_00496 [Faustovirus]AMP43974.1 hypothetical protein PRJ_Dakar_00014 [Faustovirus]